MYIIVCEAEKAIAEASNVWTEAYKLAGGDA